MTYDVIIAGGGVAGAAAAAALNEFDYRVLVVEPGLDHARRLAGELIHPPGVADLNELGLLTCLKRAGGMPVEGFAAFFGAAGAYLLPYAEAGGLKNRGLAIEHAALSEELLGAVTRFSNVTVWKCARVTAIDLSQAGHATVTVASEGRESQLRAQLLIAADGRNSHVRRMAGIRHEQVHLSNMVGYVVKNNRLPHPGFGHVFAGGPAPALAYEIAPATTRIMFDLPVPPPGGTVSEHMQAHLDALPQPLRSEVDQAMAAQTPLNSANYSVIPETVIKGRLVCVGDAGGSCHPLSATGLSACTRDAMLLRQSLRETPGDLPGALQRYSTLRAEPQRTRLSGAEVLYEVFKAGTPEMRLLRQGLLRYWQRSARGRDATMALLSTQEGRTSVLMREYIQVYRHALAELIHGSGNGAQPVETRSHAMVGLSRALVRFVVSAISK